MIFFFIWANVDYTQLHIPRLSKVEVLKSPDLGSAQKCLHFGYRIDQLRQEPHLKNDDVKKLSHCYIGLYISKLYYVCVTFLFTTRHWRAQMTRSYETMKFPFAIVALNCSNIIFGTSFFPIYLDLKLTYENILLTNMIAFPAGNYMFKVNNRNIGVVFIVNLNIFHTLFYCFYS